MKCKNKYNRDIIETRAFTSIGGGRLGILGGGGTTPGIGTWGMPGIIPGIPMGGMPGIIGGGTFMLWIFLGENAGDLRSEFVSRSKI